MFEVFTKFLLLALTICQCTAYEYSTLFSPLYHLYPPYGAMSTPTGFCMFKDEFHTFYQLNPESNYETGIPHWGHAKSTDLFHWEHLPIAMYPDQAYDNTGVYSGSAIVDKGTMYLFYTGNVNHSTEYQDNTQQQALASSTDGFTVTKYVGNPVIKGKQYQPHVRDPKVWKHGDTFYMVLGNSFNNTHGRVLLYSSKNLISWKQKSILYESDGTLGYMWENPDFFELNGKFVLLFSTKGMEPQGDKYRNHYQTGYIVGHFNYKSPLFRPITEFKELDHGHDFYTTQTMVNKNRRILMAWMDSFESYPELAEVWSGQMSVPRVLSLSHDHRIVQQPVKELSVVRGNKLYSGKLSDGCSVMLTDKAGEIQVRASKSQDFELIIESANNVTVSISYDHRKGTVTLDRGSDHDGIRRTRWRPHGDLIWQILMDASSIELFCGEGEVTFSSRYFPSTDVYVKLGDNMEVKKITIYEMQRTVPFPNEYGMN